MLDGDDTPKVEQLVGVPAGLPPNSVAVTGAPPATGVPMLPQFGQPVPGKDRLVIMLRCSNLNKSEVIERIMTTLNQCSHLDWKTWKNVKVFCSQGKVRGF